jgi:hypothetical protein
MQVAHYLLKFQFPSSILLLHNKVRNFFFFYRISFHSQHSNFIHIISKFHFATSVTNDLEAPVPQTFELTILTPSEHRPSRYKESLRQ